MHDCGHDESRDGVGDRAEELAVEEVSVMKVCDGSDGGSRFGSGGGGAEAAVAIRQTNQLIEISECF